MAAVAVLLAALLGTATIVAAGAPSRPVSLEPTAFTLIEPEQYTGSTPTPEAAVAPIAPVDAPLIADFDAARSFSPEEAEDRFGQPDAQTEANPKSITKRPRITHRVRGDATWYCKTGVSSCHYARSGGMYAAAGAEIRVGDWRGRQVQVCQGGACIWVTLIDWCACEGDRIIDLYSDAYRRLDSLSSGVLPVTVGW
jgi:hypothetical protein